MKSKNKEILRLINTIRSEKRVYEFHRGVIDIVGASGDKSERACRVILYSTRKAGEIAESMCINKRKLRELMLNQNKK